MNNIKHLIGVLAVVLLPFAALADNPPVLQVRFDGNVIINGAPAPAKTVVSVKAGDTVASYTLSKAGEYSLTIPADAEKAGTVIKFEVNGKAVPDTEGRFKMLDVMTMPSANYDLAVTTSVPSNSNSGGGGTANRPITPATPADPKTDTPATPASPAGDANGQVKGETDVEVRDGDIIQCKNSANPFAVYIVKIVNGKKYIRHIVSLQIFNHYKHLRWENLIQVPSLSGFALSGWVRVNSGANGAPGAGDRVWEINGDQTRHWINMTAAEFLLHGGSEEAIYAVNAGELNLYREGAGVRLQ
jgi:hypothetical protein